MRTCDARRNTVAVGAMLSDTRRRPRSRVLYAPHEDRAGAPFNSYVRLTSKLDSDLAENDLSQSAGHLRAHASSVGVDDDHEAFSDAEAATFLAGALGVRRLQWRPVRAPFFRRAEGVAPRGGVDDLLRQ